MSFPNRSAIAAVTFAAAVLAGCNGNEKSREAYQDPFFPPRGSVPASTTMSQKQFAIGALEDGMLFAVHFDGADLSALGRQKLDAMASARPASSLLRVYLNLPRPAAAPTTRPDATQAPTQVATDDLTAARQANVETALRAGGLTADQYALAIGPNPGALRSAEAGVFALDLKRGTVGDASVSGTSTNLPVGLVK